MTYELMRKTQAVAIDLTRRKRGTEKLLILVLNLQILGFH
jgi:hypothetical protein